MQELKLICNLKELKSAPFDWERALINFVCWLFRINVGNYTIDTVIPLQGRDVRSLNQQASLDVSMPLPLPMPSARPEYKNKWAYANPETKKLAEAGFYPKRKSYGAI